MQLQLLRQQKMVSLGRADDSGSIVFWGGRLISQ